jgi:glutathione S-transferase
MSTYKLYYFNGRGRAEASRLLFTAAGQKFEDIRYERNEWPSHKSEMPLGQMPVLEVDGVKLPQSIAIARFLAKRFDLYGKNDLQQAQVDVVDTVIDLMLKFSPIFAEQDEDKKKTAITKFLADELPSHLQNLETLAKLYSDGGSFFVGNHLTWCDLEAYNLLEYIVQIDGNVLQSYPWLNRNRQEVEKQPKIASYLKNRPSTPY